MSKEFNFKCNRCGGLGEAQYNGEHWIAPKGWLEVIEDGSFVGHLCPACNPFLKPTKVKHKDEK